LQGNPYRPNPSSMGRPMESDDAARLVSSNEKGGLSACAGLSKDGVLCQSRNPRTDYGRQMAEIISSFKELRAYQEAVRLQEMVFEESKLWPKEELYALTSQIRRSSRAIGAAMAEAWAKRRYPALSRDRKNDWGDDGKARELLPFFVPRREKMSIAVLQKAVLWFRSSGIWLRK